MKTSCFHRKSIQKQRKALVFLQNDKKQIKPTVFCGFSGLSVVFCGFCIGFFGFFGKVAALLGPLIYGLMTVMFDSRVGIFSISLLIVAGAIILRKVDVEDGIAVAKAEDERNRSAGE